MRRLALAALMSLIAVASGLAVFMAGTSLASRPHHRPRRPARPSIKSSRDPSVTGERVVISGHVPGARRGTFVVLYRQLPSGGRFTRIAVTKTDRRGNYVFRHTPGVLYTN